MKVVSIEKAEFWKEKICEQQQSGLIMKEFCEKNRLPLERFKYWKYKIANSKDKNFELQKHMNQYSVQSRQKQQSPDNNKSPQLLPVCVIPSETITSEPLFSRQDSNIYIQLKGNNRLVIPDNFNPQSLKKILEVISTL